MEFCGPVNGDIVSQVLSDVLREGEFISHLKLLVAVKRRMAMRRPAELAGAGGRPLLCDRSLSTTSGAAAWPEGAPDSGGAARGGKGAFQGGGWPAGELDLLSWRAGLLCSGFFCSGLLSAGGTTSSAPASSPGGPASSAPASSALASSLLEAPPPLLRPPLLEGPPPLLEAPPPLLKAAAGRRGREPSSGASSGSRPALVRGELRPSLALLISNLGPRGRRSVRGRGFLQNVCLMGWAAGGPSNSGRREY
jgi:hypothetical protein